MALFFVLSCVVSAQYLTRWGYDPYAYLTPTQGVSEAIEARTPHKSNRMFGSLVNRFILENQDSRIENLEIEIQKLKGRFGILGKHDTIHLRSIPWILSMYMYRPYHHHGIQNTNFL